MLTDPRYSLVIPLFNEEAVMAHLFAALDSVMAQMDAPAEAVLVDDGSRDNTASIAAEKCRGDARYRLIRLSRNFGQQAAMTAGMDHTRGDAVIVMDGDLQDPPEVALAMIAKWREGFDVVYAQRTHREADSRFKRATARLFYKVISALADVEIPPDTGDFRLVDRAVLDAFRRMNERDRWVRGMFAWLGFRQTVVQFRRPARAAGETKYSIGKLIALALSGIIGFSDAPLRFVLWAGASISGLAMLYGTYAIAMWFARSYVFPGWTSTVVVTAFLAGINMLMTGMVGLYVGRIYKEVKGRPLYFVRETEGFSQAPAQQEPFAPLARLRESFGSEDRRQRA